MRALAAALATVGIAAMLLACQPSTASPQTPAARDTPAVTVNPGVVASLASTESAHFNALLPMWHNTSSTNATVPHAYPVNMTLFPAHAALSATLTVQGGTYLPYLYAYQGSAVLLNATVAGQVTVSPSASATPLDVEIKQLFTLSGGAVSVGTYHLWVNITETAQLANTTSEVWAQHAKSMNVTYSFASPYGYYLNSSTVFMPFPSGLTANFTSVRVANATSHQVAYAGVYATNATLAPGKGLTLTFNFTPEPIDSGPAVLITLTTPRLVHGTTATYTAFGNWTNSLALPYAGLYVLGVPTGSFNYTIDGPSVQVRTGTVALVTQPGSYGYFFEGGNLPSSHFTTQGSSIVVVPDALTVGVSVTESFEVNFTSLSVPPSASLVAGTVLISGGGFSLTFGALLLGLMAIPVLYAAVAPRVHRGDGAGRVRAVAVDVLTAEIALFGLLALSVVV